MRDLQQLLDEFLARHDDMPGVLLHVDAPSAGVSWSGAAGVIERGGPAMAPDTCFRTASVTKTFVAVSVLRLVDRSVLALDDRLVDHLPSHVADLVASHTPHVAAITLRHVLQHTSGVYDFGTDDHYRRAIAADPRREWGALDLVGLAFEHGSPTCIPGAEFHYSDTGYVLLALVLEHHTGLAFAPALRDLALLDELGLGATWLEGKEPAPADAPPRAHQYVGATDTHAWDPSFDGYGGGGLVSTTRDLARFFRAVVAGDVLTPGTRAAMQDTSVATPFGLIGQTHGLGLFQTVSDGVRRLGHEGFWGVWAYHFPDHDVTVAGVHTDLAYDPEAKEALVSGPVRLLAS